MHKLNTQQHYSLWDWLYLKKVFSEVIISEVSLHTVWNSLQRDRNVAYVPCLY